MAFAAFLAQRRKRLLYSPLFESTPQGRARARRLAARTKANITNAYFHGGQKRRIITAPDLLLYKVQSDPLRDTICPDFLPSWKNISDRLKDKKRGHIRLTEFSFIRNPIGTLEQIRELIEAAGKCLYIQLDFADKYCDDIAPYVVLARLMKALPRVFVGGAITGEMLGVLPAVGLDRPLGINRVTAYRERSPLVLPFKMYSRMPPGFFGDLDHQLRPQHKELVADRFFTALEQWLSINDL